MSIKQLKGFSIRTWFFNNKRMLSRYNVLYIISYYLLIIIKIKVSVFTKHLFIVRFY